MRLTDIAEATVSHLIGRLLRRAILFVVLGVFAIIAFYYGSAAGTIALTEQYGSLNAYMIMTAGYAVAAAIVLIIIYATRAKPVFKPLPSQEKAANLLSSPRNMQIAMLIEAVMLGYSMGRKSGKNPV